MDLADLESSLAGGNSVEDAAEFLCRSVEEVIAKATELGYLTRH